MSQNVKNFKIILCCKLTGDEPDIGGPCPISHYCPSGTDFPLACPAGTYNNITGQANCTECLTGYYCPENTTTYEDFPCPVGNYCPPGTKASDEFKCPRGTYRDQPNGQSESDCLPCTGGNYCGTEGLSAVSGQCNAGRLI